MLLLLTLGLCLLRRRPDPYINISPFTSTASTSAQGSEGHAASLGLSAPANSATRPRGLAGKHAAMSDAPSTSQIPQARPATTTTPHNGSRNSAGHMGPSPASGASRPETTSSGTTTSQSDAQPALVDRIIELIAERIDRRPGPAADGSEAPPRYPESAVGHTARSSA